MKSITKYDFLIAIKKVYISNNTHYLQLLESALNMIIYERLNCGNYIENNKDKLQRDILFL